MLVKVRSIQKICKVLSQSKRYIEIHYETFVDLLWIYLKVSGSASIFLFINIDW